LTPISLAVAKSLFQTLQAHQETADLHQRATRK
jgi:hypothetical protein